MAIVIDQVTSWDDAVSWMQTNACPNYFSTVSGYSNMSESGMRFYQLDNQSQLVFDLKKSKASSSPYIYNGFFIYRTANDYIGHSMGGAFSYDVSNSYPMYLGKCDGGILIQHNYVNDSKRFVMACIITKTNHGDTAIICSYSDLVNSSNTFLDTLHDVCTDNVYCGTFGDAVYSQNILKFGSREQYQTQFATFVTLPQDGVLSYTPNAYYMPCGQYYSIEYGRFASGGDRFLTNGYWAIKDAAVEVED